LGRKPLLLRICGSWCRVVLFRELRCRTHRRQDQEVDKLAAVVGDLETVADVKGWLSAERREMALTLFEAKRGSAETSGPGSPMARPR
jgi:hypothetical protein